MYRKINRLNEEISRWAFEIKIEQLEDWKIVFTNPTAGPWKKIQVKNSKGQEGEVYRFKLEEKRPDIVAINDDLKLILIIEAKDDIEKLLNKEQLEKTVKVTEDIAIILKETQNNIYWENRYKYDVVLGLLWGSNDSLSTSEEINKLFKAHLEEIKNKNNFHINENILVGIETNYNYNKNIMKCLPHYYGKISEYNKLITSLNQITNL